MDISAIIISGLLIIIGVVLALVINGINNRITDLKGVFDNRFDDFKELIETKLEPIKSDIAYIKTALSNHVTDTDKKIDGLSKEVNSKLDRLLNQSK